MVYQYLSRIGCSKSHLHNQMVKFEYISDDMSWNGGYYYVLYTNKKYEMCYFLYDNNFLRIFYTSVAYYDYNERYKENWVWVGNVL